MQQKEKTLLEILDLSDQPDIISEILDAKDRENQGTEPVVSQDNKAFPNLAA